MESSALGKVYGDGEIIVKQGEVGDCMYVIQEGQVEILVEKEDSKILVKTLDENDYFGEMAIFDREVRSATVRALGEVRVLTIDRKNFLRGIHEDPSIAFRLVQAMSQRIRDLTKRLTEAS